MTQLSKCCGKEKIICCAADVDSSKTLRRDILCSNCGRPFESVEEEVVASSQPQQSWEERFYLQFPEKKYGTQNSIKNFISQELSRARDEAINEILAKLPSARNCPMSSGQVREILAEIN